MKTALKFLATGMLIAAAAALVLYLFFGLRIVLDGGGTPRLAFVVPADAQAAAIARHRAAQRANGPASGSAGRGPATQAPPTRPDAAAVTGPAPEVVEPATQPPAAAGAAVGTMPPEVTAADPGDAEWPDFRGPFRDGHYRQTPIRTNWPASGLTPLWHQPAGSGYASFVIAGSRAFTIEQRRDQEVVVAYEVETGRELWTHGWPGEFREFMGGDGPRATPTWADGRVYALGALGELRCLEAATGRLIWRRNILEDNGAQNLPWAMAAAPLVVDDTVVVLPGGPNGRSVVAYDKHTGDRVWSALDDQQAYTSPMLVRLAGERQLLVVSATRMMGLTPESGTLLWEYPWSTAYDINAAQPIVVDDRRVFISAGYGHGAALVEISRSDRGFAVREVWQTNRMKNRFNSSVLHDGHIYGFDEAIMACLDVETGELKWKGGRYGYGQVLLAGGHLIVLSEDGDLALVRATPERHEELVRFPVLDGKTWNHPAMASGRLLVRNLKEMAAFDLRQP
jgi:outer membrane protein assembly factor BamB